MKIAIYHDLPSGGAKRTLFETVNRLVEKHQIDVYTLSCANHSFADLRPYVAHHHIYEFSPIRLLDSPFGRFNPAIRLANLVRLRTLTKAIARTIEEGNYDIAYIQPCQFENTPSVLRFLQELPAIYYCQEQLRLLYEPMPVRPYDQQESIKRRVLNRIDPLPFVYRNTLRITDQKNIHCATMVLVNSEFTREGVNRIYQKEARVSYLGVNTQFFKPLRIKKQHMVLSVGSLTPLKGFDFLIQVMSRIPKDQRPLLMIACNFQNPPERDYLEGLARSLGVNIKILVNVSDEDLVTLYNQAKVVVYTPIREPFGLVPLESLSCETPVIAVKEGGIIESIVHQKTGLLLERDPEQFSEAVVCLLSNPALAKEYGKNGREDISRNWTWEKATANLERYMISCSQK